MGSTSSKRGSLVGFVGGTAIGVMSGTVPGMLCQVCRRCLRGARVTTLGAVRLVEVGMAGATL